MQNAGGHQGSLNLGKGSTAHYGKSEKERSTASTSGQPQQRRDKLKPCVAAALPTLM